MAELWAPHNGKISLPGDHGVVLHNKLGRIRPVAMHLTRCRETVRADSVLLSFLFTRLIFDA